MNHPASSHALPLLTASDDGCCSGGGCGCGSTTDRAHGTTHETDTPRKENQMTGQATQTFQVTGMTCGHCASAVTEELQQLPGVSDVAVDLVAGSTSTVRVTGSEPLDSAAVAAALEEAGDYQLA